MARIENSSCPASDLAGRSNTRTSRFISARRGMNDGMTMTAANGSSIPMDTSTNNVVIGPDLNESRPPLDKKEYRQILLPNGLRAVLVSDTVAMHQAPLGGYYDGDDHSEESSDGESIDKRRKKWLQ